MVVVDLPVLVSKLRYDYLLFYSTDNITTLPPGRSNMAETKSINEQLKEIEDIIDYGVG